MNYFSGLNYAFEYYVGIPLSLVLIPLIAGLVILILSKENRFKRALISFFVMLVIVGVVVLPGFFARRSAERNELRVACEEQRQADIDRVRQLQETNPDSLKNVYNPPPCNF